MKTATAPAVVTVMEYDRRTMSVRVDGQDWWVVLTSTDGTEVEIPGELVADRFTSGPPMQCEYVGTNVGGFDWGCPNLADPAADDGYCPDHGERDGRWQG